MNADALTTRRRGLGAAVAVVLGLSLGAPTAAHAALSITASPATPRPGETVTFSAAGTCDGICWSWSWKVGSQTILATGGGYPEPVAYTGFPTTGTYKVTLSYLRQTWLGFSTIDVVRDITVVANRAPAASFTVSPAAATINQAVTFTDTSTDPDGDARTRAWDLDGDGRYDDGDGRTVSRAFPTPGAKSVRLKVTDRFGAESVSTQTVNVANVAPTVALNVTPTSVQTGEPVSFSAVASDPDGGTVTYAWDLDGDGQYNDSTAASPPSGSYPRSGTRTIGVRVTDDDGDPATSTVTRTQVVTVTNRAPSTPTITANPSAVARGESVQLTAAATDPERTPLAYGWDFNDDGDYTDAAGATVARTMPPSGVLGARVRATDADGGTAVSARFSLTADAEPDPPPPPDPSPVAPAGDPGTSFVSDPPPAAAPATSGAASRSPATKPAAARLIRPFPRVRIQGRLTRRGATFTRITVTAPRGTRVTATCAGRGCPAGTRATIGRAGVLRLTGLLGTYRAGTRIVIRATRGDAIGKHTTIVVRRGRPPLRADRCLRPGATVPTRCPAN